MVANNKINLLLVILIFTSSNLCTAEKIETKNEVIDYAKREVMIKTSLLGEQIMICDDRIKSAEIPNIDTEKLKEMGASREQIIKSLSHLSTKNYSTCENGTREALAYAMGTLSTLAEQYKVDIESIQGIQEHLIYPSSREIKAALEFAQLNDDIKQYLIESVGDQPFNLLETLKKNNLSIK